MTTVYCPTCKHRSDDSPPVCECGDDEWIPFFEFRWEYACQVPQCSFTCESHHDCGRHYRDAGHGVFEPRRVVKDRSGEPVPPGQVERTNKSLSLGVGDGA